MKRKDYLFEEDETPIEGDGTHEFPEDDNVPEDGHPEKPGGN